MSAEKCIICRAEIPEGRQVCPQCEAAYKPKTEILQAMRDQTPVKYDGLLYGCISAVIFRTRASHHHRLKAPVMQVELMSRNRGCVVIADPEKIEILKR